MMPEGDETQVQERELLENYVQFILNALEAILKEGQTSLKYVRLITKKINAQLQEKYPSSMFHVGPNPPSHHICL